MAFSLPVFNLLCNIYTGPWLTKTIRLTGVACNLAWGRRVSMQFSALVPSSPGGGNDTNASMTLLLPALTDVRAAFTYPVADVLEVPAGSGRWYIAAFADDIGKGFPNEHRGVILGQLSSGHESTDWAGAAWPIPMP